MATTITVTAVVAIALVVRTSLFSWLRLAPDNSGLPAGGRLHDLSAAWTVGVGNVGIAAGVTSPNPATFVFQIPTVPALVGLEFRYCAWEMIPGKVPRSLRCTDWTITL